MRLGVLRRWSSRAQLLEHPLARVLIVAARGEALPCVVHRHFEQAQFFAALRHQELDFFSAPFGEQLGAHVGILQRDRHDHLVRRDARARIELREQVGEDVLVGEFQIVETPSLRIGELAAAHHQHDRLDKAALAIKPEDVLVDTPVMQHGLALDGLFDRAHLVAQARRLLELQPLGMLAHPFAQLLEHFEVAPLKQHLRGVQMAFVFGAVDRRQHGPRHRLIWYSRHGRERLRKTASEQVRSGKTLRMTSMVSRKPSAEPKGPKYLPPSRTILRVTMMRGHG